MASSARREHTVAMDGVGCFGQARNMVGESIIATVAALIGDTERAAILTALADGRTLPQASWLPRRVSHRPQRADRRRHALSRAGGGSPLLPARRT
jgi:hypothetical protein